MTLAAGLTSSGFVAPTFQEILDDIAAQLLVSYPQLDTAPDQPIGQVMGVFAEKLAEAYEIVATLYGAFDPNSAEGRLLANLCAITGTIPRSGSYSSVVAQLNLNGSTTVSAGAVAYVVGQPQNRWVLAADVVNTLGTPAVLPGVFRSEQLGSFNANANTLTQIATATPGWTGINNATASTPGNPAESDSQLRQRRAVELLGQGNGDIDAIRAHVEQVANVLNVIATENNTDVIAPDGTPAHAFHVIIWDGGAGLASRTDVAQAIWNTKPSGIQSFGALTVNATDSLGNPQPVSFDLATAVPIYISLATTPGSLTSAQVAAVKQAIVNYAEGTVDASGKVLTPAALGLGQEVIALALRASALLPGVVTDIPMFELKAGSAPGPGDTVNIPILGTQIAQVNATRILVNGF